MEIILILFYAIGCVLTYGRFKAQSLEMQELTGIPEDWCIADWFFILLSWPIFIGTVISYFMGEDKYFLKF